MKDPIVFNLKAEDRADDSPAMPALVHVETVQPRRVRSQLAELDALLMTLQDDVYAVVGAVPMGAGRESLRAVYRGLTDAQKRTERIRDAVERGD